MKTLQLEPDLERETLFEALKHYGNPTKFFLAQVLLMIIC